jgi:hypothetical protein
MCPELSWRLLRLAFWVATALGLADLCGHLLSRHQRELKV